MDGARQLKASAIPSRPESRGHFQTERLPFGDISNCCSTVAQLPSIKSKVVKQLMYHHVKLKIIFILCSKFCIFVCKCDFQLFVKEGNRL